MDWLFDKSSSSVNDEVLLEGLSAVMETESLKRDFTVQIYSSNKRFLAT